MAIEYSRSEEAQEGRGCRNVNNLVNKGWHGSIPWWWAI